MSITIPSAMNAEMCCNLYQQVANLVRRVVKKEKKIVKKGAKRGSYSIIM